MQRHRRIACVVVAAALLVAACSNNRAFEEAPPPANLGIEAPLRPLGSGISGKVRVVDRGDGVAVLVSIANVGQGTFRVAFHENGNCSSPNAFSAGPLWSPPGSSVDPRRMIPPLQSNTERNTEAQVHVAGVRSVDLMGRSVLIYDGSSIPELRPGVPNNVLACGVFSATLPISF
ncbi:MAG TPA: hypothetical protein VMV45_09000 [Casimicrobiaceae bacterium]|nr:hypothetical protein [Casimicrobiaceae bacterium]